MEEPKLTLRNIFGHWKTVRAHRKWVRHYCRLCGITWRGWKHDLSKYSPIEFFESARFWTGTSSPINEAKKYYGWSRAWLHHKGRNSHHYEYYIDNFDDGGIARLMTMNDFVELVCDYLGAAKAYMGDYFSYTGERTWWLNKREKCAMHPKNKLMLDIIFSDFEYAENHMLSGCPTALIVSTPESLMKSGYVQEVWRANVEQDRY